jgi:hypothetical protein
MKNFKYFTTELVLLYLLITFGVYLALTSGYGSDEDTLPMIGVFQEILKSGKVMYSRFTGYPVAELGIGFLAHYFGSWAANVVTFFFFLAGIIFFYLALNDKKKNLIIYLLLCLSSPVLFFDNLEPIDYSWAFLFFSIGIFCLKKNLFEIAILMFGFCIGCRINFTPFVLAASIFFDYNQAINLKRKIIIFLCSFVIGGLFYLTIWYTNKFGLTWITAARPDGQGFFGFFFRFTYKTLVAIGPFFSVLLIIAFFLTKNNIKSIKNFHLTVFIILINLVIFFYIPAELSYLQPLLICLFYLMSNFLNKKIIYLFIFFNLFNWFQDVDLLKIHYKNNEVCNNVEAISAELEFKLKSGKLNQFYNSRDKISKCWIMDKNNIQIYREGRALKHLK